MNLFPQIIIPLAFASLIQQIFSVSQFTSEGAIIVFLTWIGWYFFVTKTARGKMVYDSWFVSVEPLAKKTSGNDEPSDNDIADHEHFIEARVGEYSSYGLWKKFIEKDEFLRKMIDIECFVEELLEINAIESIARNSPRQNQLYKIKSEKMTEEHVKKYFERPLCWQKFMALRRRLSKRKSA